MRTVLILILKLMEWVKLKQKKKILHIKNNHKFLCFREEVVSLKYHSIATDTLEIFALLFVAKEKEKFYKHNIDLII